MDEAVRLQQLRPTGTSHSTSSGVARVNLRPDRDLESRRERH